MTQTEAEATPAPRVHEAPAGTEIIADLTGADPAFTANPYPYFAKLRALGPVHRARVMDGRIGWLIVDPHEARAMMKDRRFSTDARYLTAWPDMGRSAIGTNMLQADPPDHTRLRRLVAKEFTPRRIEALRPRIQEITDELLDAMVPAGRADLVRSFSLQLPLAVICELFGVPEKDREDFHRWSSEMSAPPSQEAGQAAGEAMAGYLGSLIAGKRADNGNDLLGDLVRTTDAGDRLTDQELFGMAFLLLVAGHETTNNLIASAVATLLRHPEQLAALRADYSLLDSAIEETMRYEGPVEVSAFRYTTETVVIGGTEIPAGEVVMSGLASASRDPERFSDPESFNILRDPRELRGHIGFGHGIHACIGAPLAKLEAGIALRSLLERCPGLALDIDPEQFAWRPPTLFLRSLERLPVRFGTDR
ncbi:cytochrome P450 family protein [Streptomyces sp. cmx-18-6]|uniref:cytochrome P450 family protein n=1 Tax=Streptomyces sp. cmx-18-6 TaxID=2790930 RepID=UPI00397FF963